MHSIEGQFWEGYTVGPTGQHLQPSKFVVDNGHIHALTECRNLSNYNLRRKHNIAIIFMGQFVLLISFLYFFTLAQFFTLWRGGGLS